jgi:hypothetical protein
MMPVRPATIGAFSSGLAGRSFEIRLDGDEALGPQTLGDGSLPNIKGDANNPVSITIKDRVENEEDVAEQRTLSLNAVGSLFKLAAGANVELAIENVALLGLASSTTRSTAAGKTWTPPGDDGPRSIIIPDNSYNTTHIDNTASLV